MGLQQFEQRLERLVEGAFAKAFRSGLQPVEVGRRLVREMDLHRTVGVRGVLMPNHFTIALSAADRERWSTIEQMLTRELTDTAREHAKAESAHFPGPVEVALVTDPAMSRGSFRVGAAMVEGGPRASIVLANGTRVGVGDDPITLGRASECEVVLADPTVSKRHAELRREGNSVTLVDLGSTNGTKVNGAGIKERVLVDGDEIRIGATVLKFETV